MRDIVAIIRDRRIRLIVAQEMLAQIPSLKGIKEEFKHSAQLRSKPFHVYVSIARIDEFSAVNKLNDHLSYQGIKSYVFQNTVLDYTFCFDSQNNADQFTRTYLTPPTARDRNPRLSIPESTVDSELNEQQTKKI